MKTVLYLCDGDKYIGEFIMRERYKPFDLFETPSESESCLSFWIGKDAEDL